MREDDDLSDSSPSELPTIEGKLPKATAPPILPANELISGRFKIIRFLARGGMGEVYEAEDLELREHVALKTVRPEIAADERAMLRFRREVQLARKVTHPNVCRIFDVDHHGEITFLTMELLRGETLTAHLRNGRMTTAEALPVVTQMAEALTAAHKAGIVHRDFKSPNVVLVGDRVVVTDFGLARATASGDSLLSGTGEMFGTPAYMAPEQVEGGEVTPATDVYALGVVMYEMVTGRLPFTDESPMSVAIKRLKEVPPSPRTIVSDIDPKWDATILRCLERKPADRFAEYGLQLARAQSAVFKVDDALGTIATIRNLSSPAADDPRIDLTEAEIQPDSKRALIAVRSAIEKAKRRNVQWIAAEARSREAGLLAEANQIAEARTIYAEVRDFYARLGSKNDEASVLRSLAMLQGDLQERTRVYEQALALYRQIGNIDGIAWIHQAIAMNLDRQGNYPQARKMLEESLKGFREAGDKSAVASALNNLASVLGSGGDHAGSTARFEECAQLQRELGDKSGLAMVQMALGLNTLNSGDLVKAKSSFDEALKYYRGINNKMMESVALFVISQVELYQGNLVESRKTIQQAIGKGTILDTRVSLGPYVYLALLIEEGKTAEAEQLADTFVSRFRSQDRHSDEVFALNLKTRSLLSRGEISEAQKTAAEVAAVYSEEMGDDIQLDTEITAARALGASGRKADAAKAIRDLKKSLAMATKLGLIDYQYSARLAIGEMQMKSGDTSAGLATLESLQKEASAKGFELFARKAEKQIAAVQ